MTRSDDEVWYEIDAADRIRTVGAGWSAFARANGGETLDGDAVLGSDIYAHVVGHFTKRFFREFLAAARREPQTRRTYRCDAQHLRRLIEMRATSVGDGGVRISHVVVEANAIEPPVTLIDAPRIQPVGYLRCSLCKRRRQRSGAVWREPDEAMKAGGAARVVHTVCPDCRSGVQASARALRLRAGASGA